MMNPRTAVAAGEGSEGVFGSKDNAEYIRPTLSSQVRTALIARKCAVSPAHAALIAAFLTDDLYSRATR